MYNKSLVSMIEATIFAALAMALSFVPSGVGYFSISLGMIPITLYAIRRGTSKGIFAGFLWGILHLLVGKADILAFWQGFIEYFIAYAFIGMAGFFSTPIKHHMRKGNIGRVRIFLTVAAFTGTIGRYVWHFIAGVIFWGEYAPEGMSPVVNSLVVNGSSALFTALTTSIVLIFLQVSSKRLFVVDRINYK